MQLYSEKRDYVLYSSEERLLQNHWTSCRQSLLTIYRSNKRLDFELLKQAWSYVLDVHEALSYAFLKDKNGKWYCTRVIDKHALLSEKCMTHLDLSSIQDEALQSQLLLGMSQLWLKKVMRHEPPALYHVALVELGAEKQRIYLTYHHTIMDGFSLNFIFLPEFCRVYLQIASGQKPYLPPVPDSMRDFAKAFREYTTKPELWTRGLEHWVKITADELLRFTPDKTGTDIEFYKFDQKTISATKAKRIRQVAATCKVSPLAILVFALLKYFGEEQNKWEGYIELVVHGRNAIPTLNVKRTIGFFAATTLEHFAIKPNDPLHSNLQGINHVLIAMRQSASDFKAYQESPHCKDSSKKMIKSNIVINYRPVFAQAMPDLISPGTEPPNYSPFVSYYLDFQITEGSKVSISVDEAPQDGSWIVCFGYVKSWFSDQRVDEISAKIISIIDTVTLENVDI